MARPDLLARERDYRLKALKILGNQCCRCGIEDIRVLQIDHVEGKGGLERTRRKSINKAIALGKVKAGKYQLLCANCNWIKRLEMNKGYSLYLMSNNNPSVVGRKRSPEAP